MNHLVTVPRRSAAVVDLADRRWRSFVADHPAATPFHDYRWVRAVAECYGFRTFALTVPGSDGVPVAGVPLVEVRHGRTRPRWVALPFTDHCPPLATTADAMTDLVFAIRAAVGSSRVRSIEIRDSVPGGASAQVAVRHVLPLDRDPDVLFHGFHRSQVQRSIRKAERAGVTVRRAECEQDLTEVFYGLHLSTRRRQGVPIQPRRFFSQLWSALASGLGTALVAEGQGRPLAAAVFLRRNGTVVYKYGASDAGTWDLRPNHALFWTAIQEACENGDAVFDWGRTDLDNHGLRSFKKSWGAAEVPLTYTVFGGKAPSEPAATSGLPARAAAAAIRQAPPWLCRWTGEALYRFIA